MSEDFGGTATGFSREARAGALAPRGTGLILGVAVGKGGGVESWRCLTVLREGVLNLVGGSLREPSLREGVIFDGFAGLSFTPTAAGSEKMESTCSRGSLGLSSITRDLENWVHNESRSMIDVEG